MKASGREDLAVVDRYCGRAVARNVANVQGQNAKNDFKRIMEQLQIIDFAIIDTVLYLDAYPESKEALKYYYKLKEERKMLADTLSTSCNRPVTFYDNSAADKWVWAEAPWPWEIAAN